MMMWWWWWWTTTLDEWLPVLRDHRWTTAKGGTFAAESSDYALGDVSFQDALLEPSYSFDLLLTVAIVVWRTSVVPILVQDVTHAPKERPFLRNTPRMFPLTLYNCGGGCLDDAIWQRQQQRQQHCQPRELLVLVGGDDDCAWVPNGVSI
jgi:hypothetical protein